MKFRILLTLLAGSTFLSAGPLVNTEILGTSLGGWDSKKGKAAKFERSGSEYRCWKPEVSPQLDGGIFVSVRIDHLRGRLAADDHASLEVTFDKKGNVVSARSSIALQGRRISSDLVEGTGKLGASVAGLDRTAKIGAQMISSLSAKIMRENIKEPGRVTFPAVIQHNYNLLCLAVVTHDGEAVAVDAKGKVVEAERVKGNEVDRKAVPLVIQKSERKK